MAREFGTLKRPIRCPKCKAADLSHLTEIWVGHTVEFGVEGRTINLETWQEMGDPDHVIASCNCGHDWRLRGVRQVTELYEKA